MPWDGLLWIHLAQGREKWQVIINKVMNLKVHQVRGILD